MREAFKNGGVVDVWNGVEGLARFPFATNLDVADPARFSASWRATSIGRIRVGELTVSAIQDAKLVGAAESSVSIVRVLSGQLSYDLAGVRRDAPAGSTHLLCSTTEVRFAALRPSRVLHVTFPSDILPSGTDHTAGVHLGGPVDGVVVAVCVMLAEEVLDPAGVGALSSAAGALRSTAIAVLQEAIAHSTDTVPAPAVPLCEHVAEYVEQHLDDPRLSPGSIAAALGISVRLLHRDFRCHELTVARYVEERRLLFIAAQLRGGLRCKNGKELAARVGYASRDRLTRAFKARFGVTPLEYLAAVQI